MKYQARAYTGLIWLKTIGVFETKEEAMEALGVELEKGIDMEMSDEEVDNWSEVFWSNSQVDEVSDELP